MIRAVKPEQRFYSHCQIRQFPVLPRQSAAFSAVLTHELSKSYLTDPVPSLMAVGRHASIDCGLVDVPGGEEGDDGVPWLILVDLSWCLVAKLWAGAIEQDQAV